MIINFKVPFNFVQKNKIAFYAFFSFLFFLYINTGKYYRVRHYSRRYFHEFFLN